MPHPYKGTEKPDFGHAAMLRNPHMAAYIAAVCVLWETNEEHWGIILADALSADARIGVELYLALTGSAAQGAVMNRAIELSVEDPGLKAEFASMLAEGRKRAKERNTIVHGRWGILPSRDDALVLGERDWLPRELASLNHHYAQAEKRGESYKPGQFPMTLWTKKDFEQVIERLSLFGGRQVGFTYRVEQARNARLKREKEERQQSQPRAPGLLSPSSGLLMTQPKTSPEGQG